MTTSVEGLIERLQPRWATDEELSRAAARRDPAMREVVNAFLVENNKLKREAADTLTRLSRELDEAREALAGAHTAARHIMPYLTWTIGPESPGHHPTMPSAVAAFKEAQPIRAARLSQEADRG